MYTKHKWLTILLTTLFLLFLAACSSGEGTETQSPSEQEDTTEGQPDEGTETQSPSEQEDGAEDQTESPFSTNEDLKAELESEEGIEEVMVQVEEDGQRVNVDIEVNEEQTLTVDELITNVSDRIKEEYPDYSIDIIVAQDGKLLEQRSL